MADYRSACYCGLGPGTTTNNIPLIQKSGLTTVINFALHIGREGNGPQKWGDFVFNDGYPKKDDPFIHNGQFNAAKNPDIGAWPTDLDTLKQNGVKEIFFSIGGWGGPTHYYVKDFATIQYMLDNGMKQTLVDNFTKFQEKFPAVDGFDIDCEEFGNSPSQFPKDYPKKDTNTVGKDTIVQLCEILFDLKFKVTFCPFDSCGIWKDSMQSLCDAKKGVVSWWNLQCYAGGSSNLCGLAGWLDKLASVTLPDGTPIGKNAAAYLVPGLSVQSQLPGWEDPQCPAGDGGMSETFSDMSYQSHQSYGDLAGGFLWSLYGITTNTNKCSNTVPTLADYVKAINGGLGVSKKSGNCP
jgi:hypothetical protein